MYNCGMKRMNSQLSFLYVGISKAKVGLILGSDLNKALTHILLTLPLT